MKCARWPIDFQLQLSFLLSLQDMRASRRKRITSSHTGLEKIWTEQYLLFTKAIKSSSLNYREDVTSSLFEEWFCNSSLASLP